MMDNIDPSAQERLRQHWLGSFELRQYSELIERQRSPHATPGLCGALPAKGFVPFWPEGCVRTLGHAGAHSAVHRAAEQMDRRDAIEAERGQR